MEASAFIGFNQQMVVLANIGRIDSPGARHSQMEDHRVAAIRMDQSVFRPAPQPGHLGPGQALTEIHRKGAAKISASSFNSPYPAALQHLGQSAHGGFNFW